MFSIIVAMDLNGGIGKNNKLLVHLPNDLKWFKKNTMGHPVIMGRKTYESLPGGALPGRKNIVLSRTVKHLPDAVVIESLDELYDNIDVQDENFVIGGAQVFNLFLPLTEKMYITRIHHKFEADTFFPDVDFSQWQKVYEFFNPRDERNPYDHTFEIYERKT